MCPWAYAVFATEAASFSYTYKRAYISVWVRISSQKPGIPFLLCANVYNVEMKNNPRLPVRGITEFLKNPRLGLQLTAIVRFGLVCA
jgi:hypothetical protein